MKQPNILLLFTDQQRHDTIAALGNPIIRTPVLDRLVREGTTFTRCYTPSPVCLPARHALITGMPPHATGCVDNVNPPKDRTSLMQMLKRCGYLTHGVGKMHLGGRWDRPWGFVGRDTSEEVKPGHDFRRFLDTNGFSHVIEPHGLRGEYYYLPQPSQLPARLHETTWVADRSIDFLRRRDKSKPFFLFSSFIKPHPPFESPTPWNRLYRTTEMPRPHMPPDSTDTWTRINRVQNRYKYQDQLGANDRQLRTLRAAYYSAISFIDYNLGRILGALGDEIENTLVVFSSDHGELLGDYGCFGKRSMHEASARVPCLARLPGLFPAGERIDTAVSLLDFFPTFAGLASKAGSSPHPDGQSLLDIARDRPAGRIVTSQFQRGWMGHYLATDGRWKYVYSAPDRREWLFAVNDTGQEGPNRISDSAAQPHVRRLRESLRSRFARDGYADGFTGKRWRKHPVKPFPSDPDYGLIVQDELTLQPCIDKLGPDYRRVVTTPDKINYRIITDHMG